MTQGQRKMSSPEATPSQAFYLWSPTLLAPHPADYPKPFADRKVKIPRGSSALGLPIPKIKYWPAWLEPISSRCQTKTGSPESMVLYLPLCPGQQAWLTHTTPTRPHRELGSSPSSCGQKGPWKLAFPGAGGQRQWFLPDHSIGTSPGKEGAKRNNHRDLRVRETWASSFCDLGQTISHLWDSASLYVKRPKTGKNTYPAGCFQG